MKAEDFNEVTISVNDEVIAKASGPSSALELLEGLMSEIRKQSETAKTDDAS